MEIQGVPRLKNIHRCIDHHGRVGVDKHPCRAIINRETREACGYFEPKALVDGCEETRIISGQLDLLNVQVELEV